MQNEEVLIKMLQIKQLQKEAIYTMLPDSMVDHLVVIEEESKAMMKELLGEMAQKSVHTYGKAKGYQQEAKARTQQAKEERSMDEAGRASRTCNTTESGKKVCNIVIE